MTVLLASMSMAQPSMSMAQPKMGAVILGKVQSDEGAPLGAAWVTMVREPSGPQVRSKPFTAEQAVRPDGTFGFHGLEPGVYRLCATFRGTTWLDSCEWSGPAPSVTVRAEQIVDGVRLTMKKGKALKIRLDDPSSRLSEHEKKTPGAHVLVGVVTAGGRLLPADVVGNDAHGHDYSVLVPEGDAVDILISSAFFDLADDTGKAVERAGKNIRMLVPRGQGQAKLNFSVTGVNPEKISSK